MAYCVITASMLTEEILQIAKIGKLILKYVVKTFQMINNMDSHTKIEDSFVEEMIIESQYGKHLVIYSAIWKPQF